MPTLQINSYQTKEQSDILSAPTSNKRLFAEMSAAVSVDISGCLARHLPQGYELIRVDGRLSSGEFEIALVNMNTATVIYYNHVRYIGDLGGRPVVQCLPWRTSVYLDPPIPSGLHGDVLVNHLLDRYTVLLSDSMLTASGEHFWLSQISRALHEKLSVYFWQAETGKLKQLSNTVQLEDSRNYKGEECGDIDQRLVAISKQPLPTDIVVKVEVGV